MLSTMAIVAGPKRVGRVMGAVSAGMSIGPLSGPALGGLAVDAVGEDRPVEVQLAS
jgi:MFS family permease